MFVLGLFEDRLEIVLGLLYCIVPGLFLDRSWIALGCSWLFFLEIISGFQECLLFLKVVIVCFWLLHDVLVCALLFRMFSCCFQLF